MPSQYSGGQAPYASQVFLLLPFEFSLGNDTVEGERHHSFANIRVVCEAEEMVCGNSFKTLILASDGLPALSGPSA